MQITTHIIATANEYNKIIKNQYKVHELLYMDGTKDVLCLYVI